MLHYKNIISKKREYFKKYLSLSQSLFKENKKMRLSGESTILIIKNYLEVENIDNTIK